MATSVKLNDRATDWLLQQEFYHGFLPREDLPFILMKKGDYIVRTTDRPTENGRRRDLVLSLAWPEADSPDPIDTRDIKNIVIKRTAEHIFLDKRQKFQALDELFDYYLKNPIKITTANTSLSLIRAVGLASWEYRHSHIVLEKKVGEGAYGEVYRGKINRGGKSFEAAIKTMRADAATDEKMKEVMGEARLMRMLNHPNIVRIRGVAVLEQPLYILIDYINGGGLDSYIQKHGNELSIDDRNKMAISAAWGIEFMHKQDIIHRDIAARNCLYDKKNYVKLSDFGLSRKGSFYKMKEPRKMPTKWLSPESLRSFSFYRASDVYTYGILLYEIYTGLEPYSEYKGLEARKMILNGEFPSFEKNAPAQLYSFVQNRIYVVDHEKRATMTEVVKHMEEWLQLELAIDVEPEKTEADYDELGTARLGQEFKKGSSEKIENKPNKKESEIPQGVTKGESVKNVVIAKLCQKEDNRDKDELKPSTSPTIEKRPNKFDHSGHKDVIDDSKSSKSSKSCSRSTKTIKTRKKERTEADKRACDKAIDIDAEIKSVLSRENLKQKPPESEKRSAMSQFDQSGIHEIVEGSKSSKYSKLKTRKQEIRTVTEKEKNDQPVDIDEELKAMMARQNASKNAESLSKEESYKSSKFVKKKGGDNEKSMKTVSNYSVAQDLSSFSSKSESTKKKSLMKRKKNSEPEPAQGTTQRMSKNSKKLSDFNSKKSVRMRVRKKQKQ